MNRYIFMRFPEGRAKAFTLSYDDGTEQDIRLIELLDRYGLKATFNLNSGKWVPEDTVYEEGNVHRVLPRSIATRLYGKNGHEVATHAYTHPFLNRLDSGSVCYEIIRDRKELEAQFGAIVKGHAYPYGTYNDATVEALRSCGIVYARTVVSTHSFGIPQDWLRLHPTCHQYDERAIELARSFVSMSDLREPKLFYLWGHSYEFDEHGSMEQIETICQTVAGKDDIWYANNMEIYNYVRAYESLVFSADTSRVYNPSALSVYFVMNGKPYMVKPNETITIA